MTTEQKEKEYPFYSGVTGEPSRSLSRKVIIREALIISMRAGA